MFVVVTFTPMLSFWIQWLTGPRWDLPAGDVLIVVGAEGRAMDGLIGYSTYWRSAYAVRAWKTAHFSRIIVTGDEDVAQSMADFMVCQGIPAKFILKESQSHNTQENVVNSLRLVDAKNARIAVLSSDYHMRRVYECFRRLRVNPLCIPAPDAGKRYGAIASRSALFVELLTETAKLVRYRLLGYV
jgi:uncharacterized SAM-binding protein YcdF (DUF218 family)